MAERILSDRYEVLRHIARGGMAEVYLARDHLLDRLVAVKELFPEYARDQAFVERFRREAKAAASLNHPNIVAVYDWGEHQGNYFIVMEYVDGQALRELVRGEGPILPERAAEIAGDIASALDFAHGHGVVHRDVKPGNVLITRPGEVKVTDFGIVARAGGGHDLTRTGLVMGTATYFSPEQAQGLAVDARSDIYALGVVLYEMVCAKPPFTGDDPVAIAYQHVREVPPRPREQNPDVPPDLERVILTAMTKRPDDRYPTAQAMRADLLRLLRGQPVEGGPLTAIVAEVGDPTTVADAVDATRVAEAQLPVEAGAPPPARRRRRAFVATLLGLLAVVTGVLFLLGRQIGFFDGAARVTVPSVVGLEVEEATAQLEDMGFVVDPEFVENADVAENEVFAQDPEPGAKLREGGTVRLQVSAGVGQVEVPDVAGRSLADAQRILEDAGFDVRIIPEFSDTVAEGRVIRTDPPGETQADEGSQVTIYESSGREPVVVPDVRNKRAVDAAIELNEAGLEVNEVEEFSSAVAEGLVIRTEPAGGEQVPGGSTVTMVVSKGAEPVLVPDVVGDREATARRELEDAGFRVSALVTTGCSPSDDDKVVAQNPPGGTRADRGSTVSITVCEGPGGPGPDGGD